MKDIIGKEWIRRWDNTSEVSLKASPFGLTPEALVDFRGLRAFSRFENKGFSFENADFSLADFSGRWLENSRFVHCKFKNTNFDNFSDHNNVFSNCSFEASSFSKAAIGFDTSRYEKCLFHKNTFKKTIFQNAIFKNVAFIDNRLNGIDFNASGFWNCRFSGAMKDVWFRGEYAFASKKTPQETGLHNVDFTEAHLSWIVVSNNCSIQKVKLPGEAIVVFEMARICNNMGLEIQSHFSVPEWREAKKYLELICVHASSQPRTICVLGDMKEVCGDHIGERLFGLLGGHKP